ncbi:MAG: KUP/HAK/KT family potassium transporter [Balneola sp.]
MNNIRNNANKNHLDRFSAAGLLISLGIVFGDIGTSPLYVMKAIVGENIIQPDLILGGLSCVFWTLTIQTTVKYVLLTLQADNKGEGGILALYALVRREKNWLVIPAIVGTCALLADGLITPPISVTAAIEGIEIIKPDIPVVPIVIAILTWLFFFQQFGTSVIGKAFGPIMVVWFGMLATFGVIWLLPNLSVLKAINPYYAFELLVKYPQGFWLLGAVFLCTTGAEALYSDLGHCGKKNIRVSWGFVKTALLLNYFGQGAWLLSHSGKLLEGQNPFYQLMPDWFIIPGIAIATLATIIASQALISGSFTLIKEAIGLNLWPQVRVMYPSILKGQLYIPSTNWILYAGCLLIVLLFQKSENMEGAYGLTITITMIMTTILLTFYLLKKNYSKIFVFSSLIVFLTVEFSFLIANSSKIADGGWITLLIGSALSIVMVAWYRGTNIINRYTKLEPIDEYLPMLEELSKDSDVPKYATHLVYLTESDKEDRMEHKVFYSIFEKRPKRADVYWFVHVTDVDDPHTKTYNVHELIPGKAFRVEFKLGFRIEPRINLYFRKVIQEMDANEEVEIESRYSSLQKFDIAGDFRFVIIDKILTYDYELPSTDKLILGVYKFLGRLSLSTEKIYELDTSITDVEKVPLILAGVREYDLEREDP